MFWYGWQFQTKLNKVTSELTEEKEMNRSLMKNQVQWQTKVTKLEAAMAQKEKVILCDKCVRLMN